MQIGSTGVHIPRLGLGTAPLGNLYAPVSDQDAAATVGAALAHGITFFDTAPSYGFGEAERRLGAALHGVPEDNYVLATKVGNRVVGESVVEDFTHDGVLRSLEGSLTRLGSDRVDIVHVHLPARTRPTPQDFDHAVRTMLPAMLDLRDQKLVSALGAGVNNEELVRALVEDRVLDCVMLAGRYSLLDHDAAEAFLPLCHERGVSVFLAGVLGTGILATGARLGAHYGYREAPPAIAKRVRSIQKVCDRYDVPLLAAAIQFPLHHPAVTAVVVGARTPAEVDAANTASTHEIPTALWADLKADRLLPHDVPTP